MPTARESLLRAARDAVEARPWQVVRMVEVAAAAGVSRQTLYNEFGDKAGLGAALGNRQIQAFLDGFGAFFRTRRHGPPAEVLAGARDWIVQTARADRVVRACLLGCRCAGLPPPVTEPAQLVAELRDRALRALAAADNGDDLPARCETAIRLALSDLVAPEIPSRL
ncbi:TetR/AcrR family transcriptional regulator [Streptomyces litchfieldiae]|uniref:TetR/AcrR family transcriptional regulator n=1 Tax=Streptomyces litchfieldiae TaxID=3075543 RepID=A0ABU2MM98_9ACTN|nr:TetR/AcrR family transcriptional regulator [Streptomyces sp. DSM 44938]MDT0342601.1 TetR/AcrR family transcriptional regulator [Streptomyces sp. DSM 44938]